MTGQPSQGARALWNLVEEQKQPLSQVLREHPELLESLDEYQGMVREHERSVAGRSQLPKHGHPVAKAVEKLGKKS